MENKKKDANSHGATWEDLVKGLDYDSLAQFINRVTEDIMDGQVLMSNLHNKLVCSKKEIDLRNSAELKRKLLVRGSGAFKGRKAN